MLKNKRLFTIFLIIFIDLLGFGIVLPLLPFIAERYHANEFQIGFLAATYSFFQFIAAPVLGRLSDRFGRRRLLLISQIGTFVGFILLAVSNNLPLLFLSRIIDGITGGNISIAQAYIADITDQKNRAKGMGVLGAAFGLGFIFGPIIGGLLSHWGFAAPAYFAAAISLITVFATRYFLPETVDIKKASASPYAHTSVKQVLHMLRTSVGPLIIIFTLLNMAFSAMQGTFALFTQQRFNFGPVENGYLFAFIGLMAVITQLWALPMLLKKYSERTLMVTGIVGMSIGFLLIPLSSFPLALLLPLLFLPVSNGFANPTINSVASESVHKEEYGEAMGILSSGGSLGRILGPIIGGELFYQFGKNVPFLFAGTVTLFIAFYTAHILRKQTRST